MGSLPLGSPLEALDPCVENRKIWKGKRQGVMSSNLKKEEAAAIAVRFRASQSLRTFHQLFLCGTIIWIAL